MQGPDFCTGDVQIGVLWQQAMHAFEADEDVAREPVDLFVQVCNFQLGFQVHVILDVGMHAIFGGLTVLAEQHENGENNGFERHREREKAEGIRIELGNARNEG